MAPQIPIDSHLWRSWLDHVFDVSIEETTPHSFAEFDVDVPTLAAPAYQLMAQAQTACAAVPVHEQRVGWRRFGSIDGYIGLVGCRDLPIAQRVALLYAQENLFCEHFARRNLIDVGFMWFENVVGARGIPEDQSDRFCHLSDDEDTLYEWPNLFRRLLKDRHPGVHRAALHGINEFYGCLAPGVAEALVAEFLCSGRQISPELIDYARLCAVGGAQ